ncbi:MAG: pyridoxamine 5'-phosphate oxidase family protein [Ardenticatenaceae bacterium]|nr:pyridoxamine 5'-phosphate oxidase family protein [Anaerolineales bacterium]MCB8938686.1 pyridoxamine 5'-phosphate oxidase family protein [Ardenticatenaceae bacterium]MCB8973922.1 pyridoxamine 5'-phosphate oxidase family protein [Ardenticatenaceae bacterium]
MRRRNPDRWRAIIGRLGREMTIWLASVRYDGRPHLVPVWFVWLDEKVYFATGSDTQKFTNMYRNQSVTLSLPDPLSVVIIEGEAHVADHHTVDQLADYFYHKYEWDFRYDDSTTWRLIEVTPFKILAWGDGYDETDGTRVL